MLTKLTRPVNSRPTSPIPLTADIVVRHANPVNETDWVTRLIDAARTGQPVTLTPPRSRPQGPRPCPSRLLGSRTNNPATAIRTALLTKDLNPDPQGLAICGANITGELNLEHAIINCPLSITHSRLTDTLLADSSHLEALTLTGTHTKEIDLDNAVVTGHLTLNNGYTTTGEVHAIGARIGGQLLMQGATLTNPGGDALNLAGIHIANSVFLDEGFTVTGGRVLAPGAHIGGKLAMRDAVLTNEGGGALNLENAQIDNDLILNGKFASDRVVLAWSRIGVLVANQPPSPVMVFAGWTVRDIHGDLNQAQVAQEWLLTQPDDSFSVQAWHEIASVYDRQGRPADARWLRVQAARKVTKRTPWPAKLVRLLSSWFTGYGYHTLRPAYYLAGDHDGCHAAGVLQPIRLHPRRPNAHRRGLQSMAVWRRQRPASDLHPRPRPMDHHRMVGRTLAADPQSSRLDPSSTPPRRPHRTPQEELNPGRSTASWRVRRPPASPWARVGAPPRPQRRSSTLHA